jgi:glutamate carboxypeptidase
METNDFLTSSIPTRHAVDQLQELVDIDSRTSNPEGVNRVQEVMAAQLSALGFFIERIPNRETKSGDLLRGFFQGQSEEVISFVGHADTVIAPREDHRFHIDWSKGIATGPGIADDKAGLVVMLSGLTKYLGNGGRPKQSLQIIISPNEETGSPGFLSTFYDLAKKSKLNLGFEPALANGSLIGARNGNRWYKVTLQGKSAHSGRFGTAHLNAFHEMAMSVSALHHLNNEESRTRLNVGSIEGGTGHYNVICGQVTAKIDMRFPSFELRDQLHSAFMEEFLRPKLSCPVSGDHCKVNIEIEDDCPPLAEDMRSRNLASFYCEIVGALEKRSVTITHAGGAADINHLSLPSNYGIDGLGAVGGELHTRREYIELSTLLSRSTALSHFLKELEGRTL